MSTQASGTPSGSAPPDPSVLEHRLDDLARSARDLQLAELVHQAASGSTRAFEAFYDATLGYARALARRMVRPADLDDLLADAFFQAWRDAAKFDRLRGNAVSWLLVIVRSRALDLLRRQRSAQEVELTDEAQDHLGAAPGPDELLGAAQAGSQLHAALARLAPAERWLLGLAYFSDLSHSEIAGVTGLALGTVKSSIRRAQEKLRDRLVTE